MKKMIYSKYLLIIVIISIGLTACDKFPLVKNEALEPTPAGENLKSTSIWEFISADNFHENDKTSIGLFGKAVEHAGLKAMLDGPGDYTVIILTDAAMLQLFDRIGYKDKPLTDIPPILLRNVLLNNIVANSRVRSYDLEINETRKFKSMSTDSIYFTRLSSTTDQYLFYVHKSLPFINAAANRTVIRNQNLDFKNGAGIVVVTLPVYDKLSSLPDKPTVANPTDTFFVTKDAFIQNGTAANRNLSFAATVDLWTKARSGTDSTFERRILFQFPIRQPSFTGRIGAAKIVNYITRVDGTRGTTLDFYEDQNIDWVESTLKWNNSPAFGKTIIGSSPVTVTPSSVNKTLATDITPTIQRYVNESKTFINIGGFGSTGDLIAVRPKEGANGAKLKSYIVLSGTPPSILTKVNNQALVIPLQESSKTLSLSELQFSGASNKNIIYVITSLPPSGLIIKNDKPLALNNSFSQDDIEKGVIRYLYTGTNAGTDSFTLEVKDFQGGYFPNLITVPVQIQ